MALDAERALARAEHLDLAGGVGLDPDHRLAFADVAQQRSEDAGTRATGRAYPAGSLVSVDERDLIEIGRSIHAAFPSRSRNPLRALDERAMELAATDDELRAALFRLVDVTPAMPLARRPRRATWRSTSARPASSRRRSRRRCGCRTRARGGPRSAPRPRPACATWPTASSSARRRTRRRGRCARSGTRAWRPRSTCSARRPSPRPRPTATPSAARTRSTRRPSRCAAGPSGRCWRRTRSGRCRG